jgi:hypothetical protein
VTDDLHYVFPPARAYRLNRCLFAIKSDNVYRDRFLADPAAAMTAMGLDADEQAALLAGDREALVRLGAHRYLVFMADLRRRMATGPETFEKF